VLALILVLFTSWLFDCLLRSGDLLLLVFLFILMEGIREANTMLTSPDPWRLGHWCVDLLQVKLQLDGLFVDVWDHIWRLDEGH